MKPWDLKIVAGLFVGYWSSFCRPYCWQQNIFLPKRTSCNSIKGGKRTTGLQKEHLKLERWRHWPLGAVTRRPLYSLWWYDAATDQYKHGRLLLSPVWKSKSETGKTLNMGFSWRCHQEPACRVTMIRHSAVNHEVLLKKKMTKKNKNMLRYLDQNSQESAFISKAVRIGWRVLINLSLLVCD